jgi:hypothetical protein
MKNKRAVNVLTSTLLFIILNVIFFTIFFLEVAYAGTKVNIYEQTYSKQIALLIDSAKPGTVLDWDVSEAYNIANKNKADLAQIIQIDNENQRVLVKLGGGKGYSFNFFTDAKIVWEVNLETKKLHLDVKKND